jgi:hypothetical protein
MRVGRATYALTAAAALMAGALSGGPVVVQGSGAPVDASSLALVSTASIGGCESPLKGVLGDFYPGPAASATYESLFAKSFALPHLSTHVPQGITTWTNWNGKGKTILIVSMYRKVDDVEKPSYLVAIDPSTGRHLGTVEVAGGHLGGIAIAGKYLFGQDRDKKAPTKEPVRRYKLSKLKSKLEEAIKKGNRPYLSAEKGLQTIAGAGFMQAYKGEVWAGHFNGSTSDKLYRYKVSSDGKLKATGKPYEVPAKTQGVLITSDRLIFSIAKGQKEQSKIVVTDRRRDLDDAKIRCFTAPSLSENMARIGNQVFLVFEGGSYKYPDAANRIKNVHTVDLRKLRTLS